MGEEPQDEQELVSEDELLGEEAGEEAADDAEPGEDSEEEAAAEPDAVAPPHSWSKEDKEAWAELTPKAQAIVARREAERDRFVQQKSVEAATTRNQVANEAREIIVKMHEDHAEKLATYARMISPQAPDEKLLYSNDPDAVITYQRQMAAYQRAQGQQQSLHQQIAQARAAAESEREQSQQAERASDAQRLREQLPEWFDPSSGPKLQQRLQAIGAELGYPPELMAEASSTDILALHRAAEKFDKAAKYDALMARKMETVRNAKGLPKMARPGAQPSKQQSNAAKGQQAWDRLKANPKDAEAAAAFLGI
ncbi:hypothetical protein [Sphingobium sp. YR768]|uniref:hypothetical protein n=1 Tax=Sphingobium sp. YR768 TaxID=1884365 RepID=UPI00115FC5F2|nr:hypothetical protein [Sphingobium sp. YR768]